MSTCAFVVSATYANRLEGSAITVPAAPAGVKLYGEPDKAAIAGVFAGLYPNPANFFAEALPVKKRLPVTLDPIWELTAMPAYGAFESAVSTPLAAVNAEMSPVVLLAVTTSAGATCAAAVPISKARKSGAAPVLAGTSDVNAPFEPILNREMVSENWLSTASRVEVGSMVMPKEALPAGTAVGGVPPMGLPNAPPVPTWKA